jgi:hypothetical protein
MRRFIGTRWHAEQQLEVVMTGQSQVARLDSTLTAREDLYDHGRGVITSDFARHTTEEGKSLDHLFQDGFGPVHRQHDRKRSIRMSPGHDQNRDRSATFRKVHLNLPEVAFDTVPRIPGA